MDFPSSSSMSPAFSFSSPGAPSFHRSLAPSPPSSTSNFLPGTSAATFVPYLDSSPFQLTRRSPRLSSRVTSSAFSPSPSLLTRSLSPHKRRRDSSVSGYFEPGEPGFDEPWSSVFSSTAQSSSSSRSTPLTSREGKKDERGGGSEPLTERSLQDADERFPLRSLRREEEEDEEGEQPNKADAVAASAKFFRMQQNLLRAASGESYAGGAKRMKREEAGDAVSSTSTPPFHAALSVNSIEEPFPSSSTSSTSSYPSLSSLSSAFSSPAPGPADAPAVPVAMPLSPIPTSSGPSSPSSPTFRPGESCHQCKTRRLVPDLIFCSARHMKKGRARKKKKERACRKKYCGRCLSKFYGEDVPDPGQPWVCPGCRGICSCAACKRHASRKEAKEKKLKLKQAKIGKKRKAGHVEKASAAKMVKAARVTSGTAMAAPVAAVAPTAGLAIPVSLSIPISSTTLTPSLAISVEPSAAAASVKRERQLRSSPRLQQRQLTGDVVALGPMSSSPQGTTGFPSMTPPSPTSFSFSPAEVAASSSASPPPFNVNPAFSPSPYHSSSMLLASPSGPYGAYSSFSSPLLPSSSLSFSPMGSTRRSPRLASRALNEPQMLGGMGMGGGRGSELAWRQHFAF